VVTNDVQVRLAAAKVAASIVTSFGAAPQRKAAMPLDQMLSKTVALADHLVVYAQTGKLTVTNEADAAKLEQEGATGEDVAV
jgi:hypothetical protein